MKYTTIVFIFTLTACTGTPSIVSGSAHQIAVNAVARSVQAECASILAGAAGSRFRGDVDDELARRGSLARTTSPDCGEGR